MKPYLINTKKTYNDVPVFYRVVPWPWMPGALFLLLPSTALLVLLLSF
jgi:hypothetical protein